MNPCINYCLTKFGQGYTEKCDKFCDYAKAVKEKKEVIDRVLEIIDTAQPYVDGRVDVAAELINRMLDRQAVRDAVKALKGGTE